jgi:hypothetical protein|tara:strand:- start:886 stop:1068 length:183 start_codon:yes stop_codon:yes gene_type:complete
MKEEEIKPIRERVLKNKKLAKLVRDYCFNICVKERGLFLSLIEESYKIGVEDGNRGEKKK